MEKELSKALRQLKKLQIQYESQGMTYEAIEVSFAVTRILDLLCDLKVGPEIAQKIRENVNKAEAKLA
jgi:hypothetical protein